MRGGLRRHTEPIFSLLMSPVSSRWNGRSGSWQWFEASRSESWYWGRKRCNVLFDPLELALTSEDIVDAV